MKESDLRSLRHWIVAGVVARGGRGSRFPRAVSLQGHKIQAALSASPMHLSDPGAAFRGGFSPDAENTAAFPIQYSYHLCLS